MNRYISSSTDAVKKEKEFQFIRKFEQFYNYFKESTEIQNPHLPNAVTPNLASPFGTVLPPWLLLPILQLSRKDCIHTTDSDANRLLHESVLCTNSYSSITPEPNSDYSDNPLDLSQPRQPNQINSSYRSSCLNGSNKKELNSSLICCSSDSCPNSTFIDEIKTQTALSLPILTRPQSHTNMFGTDSGHLLAMSVQQPIDLFQTNSFKSSCLSGKYHILSNQYPTSSIFNENLNKSNKLMRNSIHKSGLRKFQVGTTKPRKLESGNKKQMTRVMDSSSGKQPITRCHQCKVLFPSLDELNKHFMREHDQILQAELEHTKSWKSHAIEDSCFQSLKFIIARHGVVNSFGYPCPHCDYVAKWPTELQKHIMVHSKQRPHRCVICGLSYKWKWDLGRHFDKSHQTTSNPYKKNGYNSTNSSNRGKQKRVNSLVKLLNSTTCLTNRLKKTNSNESKTISTIPEVSSTIKANDMFESHKEKIHCNTLLSELSSIPSHYDSLTLNALSTAHWSATKYNMNTFTTRKSYE